MKINRFVLKLVKTSSVTEKKEDVYEAYFSQCPSASEPHMRYDPERRCYYFDTMDQALSARDYLKSHLAERNGDAPLYDVMSEMTPWYDADFVRKTKFTDQEDAIVIPESMAGVENLIQELEKEDLTHGDNDMDRVTGRMAIAIARSGVCGLLHKRGEEWVPISIEEAEIIVQTDPDSITISVGEEDIPF